MLTFNVVAQDAKGDPVRELYAGDLRLYDDGKLMSVAFCRPIETASQAAAPLGPREYSNRPTGGKSQSTLVLLDLLNANLAERGLGWTEIVRTLKKFESSQHLYVYLLTKEGTLHAIHALPTAESPLEPDDDFWVARIQPLLDQAMRDVNRLRLWEFQVNPDARVQKTLALLQEIASDFAAQPGRKSLVWITHGVPILANTPDGNQHDYTSMVRRIGTDLARSGITIYTVDQSERSTAGLNSMDTLRELSGLTAGQWLPSDHTEKAIALATSEGAATYQVGYVPPLDRWDGKYHKLRVTAENKNTRLRGIDGYYGDSRAADPAERLALAALGGADDSGIGIRATAIPSETVKGWIHFQVRVDPADLELTSGETYAGQFAMRFAYYTNGWESASAPEIPTQLHLTRAEHDAALRDGVGVSLDRPLPAGVSKVRIVVRDVQSGAVGSLTVPVIKQ